MLKTGTKGLADHSHGTNTNMKSKYIANIYTTKTPKLIFEILHKKIYENAILNMGIWIYTRVSQLVNGCFEPSQPLRIISGLKETFIKRYVVERTNKAELRPQEQSEKTASCRQNLWNEIQLKGPIRTEIDTRTGKKKKKEVGKLGWLLSDIDLSLIHI